MSIKLIGFRGVSAWMVYAKVIFMLPYTKFFGSERRNFGLELAEAINLEEEALRRYVGTLTESDIPRSLTQRQALTLFKELSETERRIVLLECMTMIDITDDEIMRLLMLHTDANGITYNKASIGNILVENILPMMLDSLTAASYVNIDNMLITDEELKFLGGYRVSIKESLAETVTPGAPVEEILPIAIKKAVQAVMPEKK